LLDSEGARTRSLKFFAVAMSGFPALGSSGLREAHLPNRKFSSSTSNLIKEPPCLASQSRMYHLREASIRQAVAVGLYWSAMLDGHHSGSTNHVFGPVKLHDYLFKLPRLAREAGRPIS
jgi:hypothetical protein